jgi:hypothetical protein
MSTPKLKDGEKNTNGKPVTFGYSLDYGKIWQKYQFIIECTNELDRTIGII